MVRPDFPRSIIEFQRWFPDDEACRDYLISSRWSEGFGCPRCDEQVAVLLAKRLLWQCSACRYQVSLTAGTVLHGTRTPLHLWFWAAYLMSTGNPWHLGSPAPTPARHQALRDRLDDAAQAAPRHGQPGAHAPDRTRRGR